MTLFLSRRLKKSFASRSEKREKKTVEELTMLPLCFEKKRGQRDEIEAASLVSNECSFFFILSNARITSSRALSLSLLCYFSRNSSGRKEVVVVVE